MRLPDGNGLDVLSEFVAKGIAVIVITAHGGVSDAVHAVKLGATEYLKKPIDLEELLLIVQKSENAVKVNYSLDYSRQRNNHAIQHASEGTKLLGESLSVQNVRAQIVRISQIDLLENDIAPTVMVTGEAGTGKDLAARLLHISCRQNVQVKDKRSDKPFVDID